MTFVNTALRLLLSASCLLSASSFAILPALSDPAPAVTNVHGDQAYKEKHENVTVPILYLTDRTLDDKKNYGAKRRYVVDCKHHMYYGTASVVVADEHHKLSEKLGQQLNWRAGNNLHREHVSCDKILTGSPQKDKEEFLKRLEAALDSSGADKVCVYVHGAEDSFNGSAEDAASLAYSLEMPLIMYSWPSNPKASGYFVDGGNNEWSQGHFNMFINDLSEFSKKRKIDVVIVSHSMGNRLVVRAAHLLQNSRIVSDAELVSPDIDAETFKHYIMGMENKGATIRLYSSTHDKMLALSQMLHGGYFRLGEGVGTVFGAMGRSQKKQDGDSVVSSSKVLSEKTFTPAPEHQPGVMERIDFTEVDSGFTGHSIPFDMLASMIKTNKPGPGLLMAHSKPGKGSGLARFLCSWKRLGKVNDTGDNDLCMKIIKTVTP